MLHPVNGGDNDYSCTNCGGDNDYSCMSLWHLEPERCVHPKGQKETMMILTASGSRRAKAVPLIMGDTVEKADIEICKHPSGKGDWLLGTGASGKVVPYLHVYGSTNTFCSLVDSLGL